VANVALPKALLYTGLLCPHARGDLLDLTSRFNSTAFGVICGIGASLFWAAGFVGTRHGLDVGFSPTDLAVHRFVWSGLALLPFVMWHGAGDLNGIGWGRGIVLAILGGPVFAIISNAGFLLVPLGHGGVIQPSCATLGGLLLVTLVLKEKLVAMRAIVALIIVVGLVVIGGEAAKMIGVHGVVGDLIFVLTGLMYATFGTLLRLWRIVPMSAAAAVGVISLISVPATGPWAVSITCSRSVGGKISCRRFCKVSWQVPVHYICSLARLLYWTPDVQHRLSRWCPHSYCLSGGSHSVRCQVPSN
jgi:drug/metabolite transporter (DMT)-like permease